MSPTAKRRDSNLELLRVVSMMMVLVVYMDGATLGLPDGPFNEMGSRDFWRLGVEAAVIICVNCFTLISGYFGIRLRAKGVFSFLFQCVFYSAVIAGIACVMGRAKSTLGFWSDTLMVLTHTDLWYVPAYFCLMLLSPFVNKGMDNLSRRENTFLVGLFVAYNIWAGWLWNGKFNPTGYTVMQLLMVYMIGRLMALYHRPRGKKALVWILVYLLATVGIVISSFLLPTGKAFAYNSPLVILSSIAFFYIFLCLRFHSRTVNFLARSAFAVYLVHKTPIIWVGYLKPFMLREWHGLSLSSYSLLVMGMTIGIYLAVVFPDILRRGLSDMIFKSGRGLRRLLEKFCDSQINIFCWMGSKTKKK